MRGRRRGATVAVAAVLVLVGGCGSEEPTTPTRLAATGAWARTTPTGATNGVVYLTLRSDRPDAVVGAEVPATIAAAASLHETMGEAGTAHHGGGTGGEMHMEPVAALPVDPASPLVLEPGGRHVMLEGLAAPLTAGEHLTLTLQLRSGRRLTVPVTVSVNDPAEAAEGTDAH